MGDFVGLALAEFVDLAVALLSTESVLSTEKRGLEVVASLAELAQLHGVDKLREVAQAVFKVNVPLADLVSDGLSDLVGLSTAKVSKELLFGLDGFDHVVLKSLVALVLAHLAAMVHETGDIGAGLL